MQKLFRIEIEIKIRKLSLVIFGNFFIFRYTSSIIFQATGCNEKHQGKKKDIFDSELSLDSFSSGNALKNAQRIIVRKCEYFKYNFYGRTTYLGCSFFESSQKRC